ncbi:MAG: GH3 auxin-responsive promoter family protein [Bacteroidetes bacterium]|nr:GH3 auxin-responsive promoter family protein [Bacteroidota bacterium]
MKFIGQLIKSGKKFSTALLLNKVKAGSSQNRTLRKLLTKAAHTEFGKYYQFEQILDSKDIYKVFCQKVPISNYSSMYPWWQRQYNNEGNITWPGKVEYFALSSGTSEGASKYIPVTKEMLKSIKKASFRQILNIALTDLPKDYLTKHYLMIGGSTDLHFNGNVYSGDLSGITTQNVPPWFERFSKPSMEIRSTRNWQEKIDKITSDAKNWDVVMVAGVPAWIQLLFENIIKTYNLNNIHDIWPNFSVFIHGGVSLAPYRRGLDKLMGQPIMYFETYLASEGFVAFQHKPHSKGMRLVFRNEMFYEFIPFDKNNFNESGELHENPNVIPISEVEEGKEYAILLSTCAGAWRYMIGDVVKFVDVDNCEIKITGRTKHFLSMCGEHLSVDNMTQALHIVADNLKLNFIEFTVKGVPYENFFAHQWYIGTTDVNVDEETVKNMLDETLKQLNDDYATERLHALKTIMVKVIPNDVFLQWMDSQGKTGSQNKFPRVLTDEKYKSWVSFLNEIKMAGV